MRIKIYSSDKASMPTEHERELARLLAPTICFISFGGRTSRVSKREAMEAYLRGGALTVDSDDNIVIDFEISNL